MESEKAGLVSGLLKRGIQCYLWSKLFSHESDPPKQEFSLWFTTPIQLRKHLCELSKRSLQFWKDWSERAIPFFFFFPTGSPSFIPKLQLWQRPPTKLQLLPPGRKHPQAGQEWVAVTNCGVFFKPNPVVIKVFMRVVNWRVRKQSRFMYDSITVF